MTLKRLSVRDFVIVRELDLEFEAGFSVLSGETGAGKSILLDALQLALGGRGEALVIREGAARCEISAEFEPPIRSHYWLDNSGFSQEESLLVRRSIDRQGKSRAWINGSPATISQLKELGELLVDIHGQHAWQSLTKPDSMRALLDAYGQIDTKPLREAHSAWRHAHEALVLAQSNAATAQTERERLLWQLEEINKLKPLADEWRELNASHARAAHAQALTEAAHSGLHAISESENNAAQLLLGAARALSTRPGIDATIDQMAQRCNDLLAQTEDLAHDLRQYLGKDGPDPEQFRQLDERVGQWIALSRRMRCPPDELFSLGQAWRAHLEKLDAMGDIESLSLSEQAAKEKLRQQAGLVSRIRRKASLQLSKAVTQHLQHLGMEGTALSVELSSKEADASGAENVEFLVSAHGGTARSIAKTGSGGELSRIALAISVTTSELGEAPTLVFDEVDAGVGGRVALAVGQMMRRLGVHRQVLCVTHLAQVASFANQQGVVCKTLDIGGRPVSEIAWVSGEQRVQEIARMLGGDAGSAATLAHAKEMIHNAKNVAPLPV